MTNAFLVDLLNIGGRKLMTLTINIIFDLLSQMIVINPDWQYSSLLHTDLRRDDRSGCTW